MCVHHHHYDRHMLCPHCDLLVELPTLQDGQRAVCPRCNTALSSRQREPRWRPASFAFSALIMLLLSMLFPFVSMSVAGIRSEITLLEIPRVMVAENYASMATLFLLFAQLVPACSMAVILLLCLRTPLPDAVRRLVTKMLFQLKGWGMAEIFLAGVLVSFVKLMSYGDIGIGASFVPYIVFCLLQLMAFQSLDRRWLWDDVAPSPPMPAGLETGCSGLGQGVRACTCCSAILPADEVRCPRCHTRGHARRRHSLQWTLALLLTSVLLYVPANLMPIMVTEALGHSITSTIMSGVILLWDSGSWPVALVIFIASIMVPTLKMLAMGWLCWCAYGSRRYDTERLHRVYEVVEFVGRWSMIDVFVIAVLSAMVRMGRLMSIYPAIGAVLFATVVILTMIAAMIFDPRLLWDRHHVQGEERFVDEN
ncbi:membrane integrity-associated transporter subunit PqiA [Dickeya chrysanthemi]|uniref:Membrane integrity-associated transporter subunit PqiA n=1 Tax=Dickeya chrysanthemi TaxID=556 RepID=A0ABU8JKY7_DICCH|nr:membrane integrity-associated transporter subunit PqiA [Dickeya chrysanthemi]MCA7006409.1 membrane integrity-associated transporter subunit PqiA [Dickeya chrysanthemi]